MQYEVIIKSVLADCAPYFITVTTKLSIFYFNSFPEIENLGSAYMNQSEEEAK